MRLRLPEITPRRARTLFLITVLTTLAAGVTNSPVWQRWLLLGELGGFAHSSLPPWWALSGVWTQAAGFAGALLGILFAHEMGHYVVGRREGVEVSWPLFLPSVPPLGTLGAVIRMRGALERPGPLLRMAAAGPFAGVVVAVPVIALGLLLSPSVPVTAQEPGVVRLGVPLLMTGLEWLVLGGSTPGHELMLHPVAFAGWAGCLVTALNLLPIGQLDGGHIAYALYGPRVRPVARGLVALLAVAGFLYVGWWMVAALVLWVVRIDHPPLVTPAVVEGPQRWIGLASLALFALTFMPMPIKGSGVVDIAGAIELAWRYR